MTDIVKELRSLASSDDGISPYCCNGDVCEAAGAEIERLRAALESCQSWIVRWTKHVAACEGGERCACGRSSVLYEAAAALAGDEQSPAK